MIFESKILQHRAHKKSACQFLRTHMCQMCLLLNLKASEMLVAHTRTHTHKWIRFEHARGFLAFKAFWMRAGIYVDVSDRREMDGRWLK